MTRTSAAVVDDSGVERESFRDRRLELFVWSQNLQVKGFELHYAIHTADEWSLRWTASEGTTFHCVDTHSHVKGRKECRVMTQISGDGLPVHDLHAEFAVRSRQIDEPIRRIVLLRLSRVIRGER